MNHFIQVNSFFVDIVFELLHMTVNDKSLILVGWNGKALDKKSCNLVPIEELAYTVSHRPPSDVVLDESSLKNLYDSEELINIKLHDENLEYASILCPFGYFVISKVFCKPSEEEYGRFRYIGNVNLSLRNCTIRRIEKKSLLGFSITKQIWDSFQVTEEEDISTDEENIEGSEVLIQKHVVVVL